MTDENTARAPEMTAAHVALNRAPKFLQPLRISLFGPVTVHLGEHEVRTKSLKLRGILGYLALHESFRETRERLVGLFWSESGEGQARAVLRQVMRELRSMFGDIGFEGLLADAREVGFEPESIEVDVWAVVRAAEAGVVHSLLLERPRLGDELMSGLDDLDPAFRSWIVAKRETIRERMLRALEVMLDQNQGNPGDQSRVSEAILNLDPTHENACRQLMRLRVSKGDIAGALRAYKTLWDLLDADYDMEPSQTTQELVAEIKTGAFDEPSPAVPERERPSAGESSGAPAAQASTGPVPAPRQETSLTLSLRDMVVYAVDPDKGHLVTGFRQHLVASLVRFREWQVIDAPFPASVVTPSIESAGLYELQMTAHQAGSAVHLLVTLKELETNRYIWSDGLELRLENWFASQRLVVRRIAIALSVHLSAERLRRVSEQPEISLGIYDRWLTCQTLIRSFSPRYHDRSTQQFTEIIDAAPSFVPAYCGLVDLRNTRHISCPGVFRSRETEQEALKLARKAVQLDPSNPAAQRSLAWAYAMAKQYAQAVTHVELARELNPYDSWTLISSALLLVFCGEPERGLALVEPTIDISLAPSSTHWAYYFDIQFLIGNYEAALAMAENADDVLLGTRSAWKAAALKHLDRHEDAAAESGRFLASIRANWVSSEPATDEAIVRWLLHLYPIRRCEVWERLRDGLRDIGLPTGTMAHHDW